MKSSLCYSNKKAKDVAFFETESRFGINGHNDKSDAFRHCYWSARLCCVIRGN
ncbi:DUF6973 domain-containing protein [Vibrio parahaemolyticus]|uniref:DUF6973 domain-containing protein n=1 Tax=Vibrio parahaemolyticus TaxID=670 RepID=UPI003D9A0F59